MGEIDLYNKTICETICYTQIYLQVHNADLSCSTLYNEATTPGVAFL